MRMKVVGTGSSGNCYLLFDDEGRALVLDCGVKLESVKKALDFNVSCISGCFVSHSHG